MSNFVVSQEYSAIESKYREKYKKNSTFKFSHPPNIYPFSLSFTPFSRSLVHSSPFRNIIPPRKNIYLYSISRRRRDRETVEGIDLNEVKSQGREVGPFLVPPFIISFLHFISFRSVIHSKTNLFSRSIYPFTSFRSDFTISSLPRLRYGYYLSIYNGNSQVRKKNESRFSQLSLYREWDSNPHDHHWPKDFLTTMTFATILLCLWSGITLNLIRALQIDSSRI